MGTGKVYQITGTRMSETSKNCPDCTINWWGVGIVLVLGLGILLKVFGII